MQLSKVAIASMVAALTLLAGASVADAGTVTTSFQSRFGWPTYTDDPAQGGTLLGPSEEVCGVSGPSGIRCPTGGVSYNTGGDWPIQDLSAFPSARFMWAPGISAATTPADLTKYAFSREFYLPGSPVAGSIEIAADDFAAIRVNGMVVGSIGSVTDYWLAVNAGQTSLHPFDLTQYLRPGSNTITIIGQNGPAWYVCGWPGCTDGPTPYHQNAAMVVFAGRLTSQVP